MSLIADYTGFFYPKKEGKITPLFPDLGGVGMSISGLGGAASGGLKGFANIIKKIPTPSLSTTAKIAGSGAILYTGYQAGQAGKRLFETGSYTKKEVLTGSPGAQGSPGITEPGYLIGPDVIDFPQGEGFFGNIGAGIGKGAADLGGGLGSGLDTGLKVAAVGGLAYLLLRGRK